MPHFGFMDESRMTPGDAELLRTRLHLRAARRRFLQGKVSTGVSVLFDALNSALRWYVLSPGRPTSLKVRPGEDLNDEGTVFKTLVRSKVLDGKFDYGRFNLLTEDAVNKKLCNFDYTDLLRDVESLMTVLGVMPFDERELPPEKPDAA